MFYQIENDGSKDDINNNTDASCASSKSRIKVICSKVCQHIYYNNSTKY